MKVELAAQVLSNSVADALEYCGARYPQFEGCKATINFDLLATAENYIKQLYIMVPTTKNKVVTLKRKNIIQSGLAFYLCSFIFFQYTYSILTFSGIKRGFVGILLGMKSFKNIYESSVKTRKLNFLLGFKFSQDHLETIFSVIRSRGGFNNNPNCSQFRTAFKRILMRNQLSSSINANCTFDSAQVLHFSNLIQNNNNIDVDVPLFHNDDQPIGEDEFDELNTVRLTEYVRDVISYISGFVERHLKKKIRFRHFFKYCP